MKKKEESNELFFVHLTENEKIRRDTLETLKRLLEFSQSYERIKSIRHKKIEELDKAKLIIRDVNRLISELKQKLPQANIRLPSARVEMPHKAETAGKTYSELDRLSAELRAVEEKLSRL